MSWYQLTNVSVYQPSAVAALYISVAKRINIKEAYGSRMAGEEKPAEINHGNSNINESVKRQWRRKSVMASNLAMAYCVAKM